MESSLRPQESDPNTIATPHASSVPNHHEVPARTKQHRSATPLDRGLHELFEAQVRRTPAATAVVCADQRLDYAELNRRANRLAHRLQAQGLGPEDRVGVCLPRSVDLLVAVLGVLKAGAAYVPLDPSYPPERLAFMCRDAGIGLLLTHGHLRARLPQGPTTQCLDDPALLAGQPEHDPARPCAPDQLAYVIYTSGSTGQPKGVAIEHRGLSNLLFALDQAVYDRHGPGPLKVAMNASFSFDASVKQYMQIARGHELHILSDALRYDPAALRRHLREQDIDVLDCTPSQLRLLLDAEPERPLPGVVLIGGEAIDEMLWQRLRGDRRSTFYNVYGPTECTVDATCIRIADGPAQPVIGRPLANVRAYVLDAQGTPLPPGESGELHIGGSGVAREYLNRPALSAERFLPDPFQPGGRLYKTGDLARYLPDGNIEFLGRIDHQVKIRGFRIELPEIEAAVLRQPGISGAVVTVREDQPGEQRLVAHVTTAGPAPSAEALRAGLRATLPEYMVPTAFVHMETFPLTPNGKVDRKALPAPTPADLVPETHYAAPCTSDETVLAELMAAVLGLPRVGVHDDFFALGGHSLLAMKLISRVRERLQIELPYHLLFERPTVADLAAWLQAASDSGRHAPATSIPPRARGGDAPLSFSQQRIWFATQLNSDPALYTITRLYRLEGPLRLDLLRQALHRVAARHELLRASYHTAEGLPVQRLAAQADIPIALIDASGHSEAAALRLAQQEAARPFDLERGLLLRCVLLHRSTDHHLLLLSVHNLIADGWSVDLLIAELGAAYQALLRGEPDSRPAPVLQYPDFAAWQREQMQGEALAQQLAYWREQLGGELPVLRWPVERPAVLGHQGAEHRFTLSADLAQALQDFSQAQGVTRFMLLLAAFQILLHRHTGQMDLLVGTPLSNRSRRELESIIGFFANTVALRARLGGDMRFADLLAQTRERVLGAFAHQDLPFEKMVEALNPPRSLSHSPIFQAMFALQDDDGALPALPGVRAMRLHLPETRAKFDLTLSIAGDSSQLSCTLLYNTDLLDAESIAQMAEEFEMLLRQIVLGPDQTIASLAQQAGAARPAPYPLSPMQDGMLFQTLSRPGAGLNLEQLLCRLPEALDAARLEAAWQALVERHAVLRTAFDWRGPEGTRQQPQARVSLSIRQEDWREHAPAEQERRLAEYLAADRARDFDLRQAPLLRVALFRTADADYRMLWTFPHLLLDGRSIQLLMQELFALYDTAGAARLPARPAYRDFIDWCDRQDRDGAEIYWRGLLRGIESPTRLPVAGLGVTPGAQSPGVRRLRLSAAGSERLQDFAARHGLRLSTLIEGAWALLLARYSGEAEVLFGSVHSGRNPAIAEVKSMVGLLINTLPRRVSVDPGQPLLDWLRALRAQQLESRRHEQVPLARIQQWSDLPEGAPLLDSIVMFDRESLDAALRSQGGAWAAREFELFERTGLPLTLIAYGEPVVELKLLYEREHYGDAVAEAMLGHLQTLLEGMAAQPAAKLGQLPLLTPAEHQRLVYDWNATALDLPLDRGLHELFEAQVRRTPAATAVVCADQRLDYAELNRRANRLAHRLQAQGLGPEDRVGVCLPRSVDLLVAVLGVLKAGAAYVPLDPSYPPERLAFMCRDAGIGLLLTHGHLRARLPQGPTTQCLDDPALLAGQPEHDPARPCAPDQLAYVIYTSGSTGQPKGVAIEHRGAVNTVLDINQRFGVGPDDRILAVSSLSFDLSVYDIFGGLAAGARVVVPPPSDTPDPAAWLDCLERERITFWNSAPPLLEMLVQHCSGRDVQLPQLRLALLSGDWIAPSLPVRARALAPNVRVISLGGATEASIWSIAYPIDAVDPAWTSIPYGKPLANQRFHVLDPQGLPLPVGVPGELHIGGIGVAREYLNRPELNAEKYLPDPFYPGGRLYRTGDRGRYLPDGNIEFLGRIDHQVKIRGFRIETGEIESTLVRHPAVRDCVVLAVDDPVGGKRLAAYFTCDGAAPSAAALRAFLQERLPEYMVPAALVHLDALPLSPNGKVDRKALPAPDATLEARTDFVAPRDAVEQQLAQIWAELLGTGQVGVRDNFFALGGHSLMATQLTARVRAAFQVELPLHKLFEAPTVAGLAETITGLRGQKPDKSGRMAELMKKLEHLSDDEINALLQEKKRSV
ncbi:MAG: amino acid adenylation domain-containing protein [Pseudomonadota bacterium]